MSFIINPYRFSSAFTPLSVGSLYQWLKADSYSGSDGDQVSTWNDSSGNARNATGVGATKPVYKTSIVNSLPVMRFNGSTSYFTVGNVSALTEGEVFLVIKIDNDPPSLGTGGLWKLSTHAGSSHYPFTDGTIYENFGQTTRPTIGNPTPSLSSAFRVYNVWSKTNDFAVNLNNSSLYTSGTNTVGFPASGELGANSGGVVFCDGDIAEYVLFNAKISTTDRSSMVSYLSTKYNLGL